MTRIVSAATPLVRLPKVMPSNWVLKQIAFPPPKSHFEPSCDAKGRRLPPRISPADQDRIRLACRIAGIDAEAVVGLPPVAAARLSQKQLIPTSKRALEKFLRQQKIADNMAKMPERIAAWKEERRKAKAAAVPDMPF
ncbi:hypothetical protein BC831DRAFT_548177 [Entophlyctis helioformis]|nr:hypothetical protein BC831DRAFT_548177 [Entophlyctis helioformis]